MAGENRRDFIKKTGAVAAGIGLGGSSLSAASYKRIMGANDRLQVGVIGCLRRAGAIRPSFADLKDQADVIYACDVVKTRREEYADSLKETLGMGWNPFECFSGKPSRRIPLVKTLTISR